MHHMSSPELSYDVLNKNMQDMIKRHAERQVMLKLKLNVKKVIDIHCIGPLRSTLSPLPHEESQSVVLCLERDLRALGEVENILKTQN